MSGYMILSKNVKYIMIVNSFEPIITKSHQTPKAEIRVFVCVPRADFDTIVIKIILYKTTQEHVRYLLGLFHYHVISL